MHMHSPSHSVLAAYEWEMWTQWIQGHKGAASSALTLYCVSHAVVFLGKEKFSCFYHFPTKPCTLRCTD